VYSDPRFVVGTLGEVKGDAVPLHAIKVYSGSRGVALTDSMEQSPS
jgi:hypothetical protein